jgi:hypothetical protein
VLSLQVEERRRLCVKKNLAATSSPQPVEYHSDEDQSHFVLMVITPQEDDDHDSSLFPIWRKTWNSKAGPPTDLEICAS